MAGYHPLLSKQTGTQSVSLRIRIAWINSKAQQETATYANMTDALVGTWTIGGSERHQIQPFMSMKPSKPPSEEKSMAIGKRRRVAVLLKILKHSLNPPRNHALTAERLIFRY